MTDKLGRYYLLSVLLLFGLWISWLVAPLPENVDPYGGIKLAGGLLLDTIVFVWGLLGLFLSRRRSISGGLALALLAVPLMDFIGTTTGQPWNYIVPIGCWFFILWSCWESWS